MNISFTQGLRNFFSIYSKKQKVESELRRKIHVGIPLEYEVTDYLDESID